MAWRQRQTAHTTQPVEDWITREFASRGLVPPHCTPEALAGALERERGIRILFVPHESEEPGISGMLYRHEGRANTYSILFRPTPNLALRRLIWFHELAHLLFDDLGTDAGGDGALRGSLVTNADGGAGRGVCRRRHAVLLWRRGPVATDGPGGRRRAVGVRALSAEDRVLAMNGDISLLGECLLLVITLLYSLTGVMIGRRAPYPASLAAYGAAVAVWVALPLLAEANLHRVDHVVGLVGVGLLLVHVAFMVLFCAFLLTVALATDQWAWRHHLAIGGRVS